MNSGCFSARVRGLDTVEPGFSGAGAAGVNLPPQNVWIIMTSSHKYVDCVTRSTVMH